MLITPTTIKVHMKQLITEDFPIFTPQVLGKQKRKNDS